MSSRAEYNNSDDGDERQLDLRRRYLWDTGLNWAFFVFVAIIGFWIIETDVDIYQGERLFYKMLHDGVTIEEAADTPYMQQGMLRNIQYKDVSSRDFFFAKWKWRLPIYLLCIFLPMIVAVLRVVSRSRSKWNWVYFPLMVIGISYWVYSVGRWTGMW